MKLHRINAIISHHLYFWKRSLPRWLDVFYWPILTITVWGFLTTYLRGQEFESSNLLGAMFLGAITLWMLFQRGQQDLAVSYLQDIWSRSIVNLYVSPLTNLEFIVASIVVGLMKVAITLAVKAVVKLFKSEETDETDKKEATDKPPDGATAKPPPITVSPDQIFEN